eukprot:jgi/Botrbrau1/9/Bobra.0022s0006.1
MAMVYDSADHARTARHKLDSASMAGTLEEYTQEFMSLVGDVSTEYTISAQAQVHLFRKGLAPYLKSAVTLNPATREDFQTLAALLQYTARYDAGVSAEVKTQHIADKKNAEMLVVSPPVVDVSDLAVAAVNFKRRADTELPYVLRCHKCTGFGHKQSVCPSKDYFDQTGLKKKRW